MFTLIKLNELNWSQRGFTWAGDQCFSICVNALIVQIRMITNLPELHQWIHQLISIWFPLKEDIIIHMFSIQSPRTRVHVPLTVAISMLRICVYNACCTSDIPTRNLTSLSWRDTVLATSTLRRRKKNGSSTYSVWTGKKEIIQGETCWENKGR